MRASQPECIAMNNSFSQSRHNDRQLALWLFVVAALIFGMVVLGGVTRLTESGLSMVNWKPVTGFLPPIGETEWLAEFEQYRTSPEYLKKNAGMSLDDFKSIFWFEYSHRLLGRIIGLAFLIPFLFFLWQGKIRRPLIPRFIILFILGGLQGVLGWYMVKSGLVNIPQVSQYRLTAHLSAAIILYAFILWTAMSLWRSQQLVESQPSLNGLRKHGHITLAIISIMIISGGLVAGTKAGYVFNTFPMMAGQWLPPGGMALNPWWLNFFENLATVQFSHRVFAIVVALTVFTYALRGWRSKAINDTTCFTFTLLFLTLLIQIGLGIATLLHVVPVTLGAMHQAGALLLFTLALILSHRLRMH